MRWLGIVSHAIILLLGLLSAEASAQNDRSLVGVTATSTTPEKVTVLLEFDRPAPEARIAGNESNRITVTLLATGRGPSARFQRAESGLLRDIVFRQEFNSLQMVFVTGVRTHMEMAVEGERRFIVTLTAMERLRESAGSSSKASEDAAPSATRAPLPMALPPPMSQDNFELIQLKYADVSEIVGLLTDGVTVRSNNSFNPRAPGFGSPTSNGLPSSNTPTEQAVDDRPLGEMVDSSLAINRRLNAIWVRGPPEYIAWIRAQIAKIDIPLTSVLLETEFIELTESGARNVGLSFANSNGQVAVATVQAGQFVPFGNIGRNDTPLRSISLQAALYAQIEKGQGRIISKPKIAAQSGATAKIITGDALPILTAITLSGVNGVSQQVQYVNVGVTLQIAPRVSSDGFVSSHVFCVVSSVTGYSQGYPTISQREAQTSATVRDGEAFVIGGLVQDTELKSRTKVPLLGDIPILGRVFQSDRAQRAKTELYIIITPRIVRQTAAAVQ